MAVLEVEFTRLADLMRVLPSGPEMDAASDDLRTVSDRMDEVMGVTPEFRRTEAMEEFSYRHESFENSKAA